jgi:hypothetical protein
METGNRFTNLSIPVQLSQFNCAADADVCGMGYHLLADQILYYTGISLKPFSPAGNEIEEGLKDARR